MSIGVTIWRKMRITNKLALCWFKDWRWDKTIYEVNTIRRFGKFGIITKTKGRKNAKTNWMG